MRWINSNGDELRLVVEPDSEGLNLDHITWFSYTADIDRDGFYKIGDLKRIA
jgi:hypothetical protein